MFTVTFGTWLIRESVNLGGVGTLIDGSLGVKLIGAILGALTMILGSFRDGIPGKLTGDTDTLAPGIL